MSYTSHRILRTILDRGRINSDILKMKIQGMRGSSRHRGYRGSVWEHKSQENNLKLQMDSVQILARAFTTIVMGGTGY